MTPWVAGKISDKNKMLFNKIEHIMRQLPDLDLGQDENGLKILISCHMVARAIGQVLNLKWVDGIYGRTEGNIGFTHSWLLTPDKEFIIDCYPVGMLGGPLLIDARHNWCPGWHLYKKAKKFGKNILFTSKAFRRTVQQLEKEVRQIVAKY